MQSLLAGSLSGPTEISDQSRISGRGKICDHESLDQPENELKRALRTAIRALEAANVATLTDDPHKHIADAVHQLIFVLGRLVDERSKTPGCLEEPAPEDKRRCR
jgi:hypothetical protein